MLAGEWLQLAEALPLETLQRRAVESKRSFHGDRIGHSRKVFIPLTRLCRDVCTYCTFAKSPRQLPAPFLSPDSVLAIAAAGRAAGCREALFTLGDRPESRYPVAREALAALGFGSTVDYLVHLCERVLKETGLLPHVNAGVMDEVEIGRLRRVSVSQGLMLESSSARLCERGGPHFGSPDKRPEVRLRMIEAAGRLQVPFTSGILIGIGETRLERIESLLALRDAHDRHGHLQEVIIQNFLPKPDTRMAGAPTPASTELLWTAAVARLILGPGMNIQVPPNLSFDRFPDLLEAGISDWGGISPVTADHVNPEAPWPALDRLEAATRAAGAVLVERLAIYPSYVRDASRWVDPAVLGQLLAQSDAEGYARDEGFTVGAATPADRPSTDTAPAAEPAATKARARRAAAARPASLDALLHRAGAGDRLDAAEVERLFAARGAEVAEVSAAADSLRREVVGDRVSYVVNRNINYTNVCLYACSFCAFSKGKLHEDLRGSPYDLALDEVARRAVEAWERGATEVCMQGGIHPSYTGETYLTLLRTVKAAVPGMHVHAFSPLEVSHGAATLGLPIARYLERLQAAGLGSLPGTAAEILDDDVRAVICPDKLSTREWLDVIETAHRVGLPTTSTIMFGHVERPADWATHLLHLRDLQARTGGLTEFVPLPFVAMEAPMFLRGRARRGPTWRETVLMHAVSRLVLHPLVPNVQTSWAKLGVERIRLLLDAGVNDLGGTLMNESISRAAGAQHGQELPPAQMEAAIERAGRVPRQRTTLYRDTDPEQRRRSLRAAPLTPIVLTPLRRRSDPPRDNGTRRAVGDVQDKDIA
jgi:FO synthase